ncbi:MAG: prepilin-type N-terminal cleavage/methylation domain-containing protein, partial [Proteobacteria bacterium]|nr:prepilin-type N-terminal cleavage/methylation domain-containing protein [Pseudomonadota bacterium]
MSGVDPTPLHIKEQMMSLLHRISLMLKKPFTNAAKSGMTLIEIIIVV